MYKFGLATLARAALITALLPFCSPQPSSAVELPWWLNPQTAPLVPIPDIETDPDSGSTLGIMPTWLKREADGSITRIVSPDFYRNSYFGWGFGGSIFDYLSLDSQWYVGGDIEQRVERQLDTKYQSGRRRLDRWSFTARADYDRIGTPRFFGLGNNTTIHDETNYTSESELVELNPGLNLTPNWQIAYLLRFQNVDVFPGSLPHVVSIQRRFGARYSLGTNHELTNRLMLIYDTRNDLTAPTQGVALAVYEAYVVNTSVYHVAGFDGRAFLPLGSYTVFAIHTALRYELGAYHLPFWAYSTLGGEANVLGGQGALRGYGMGRFTDRNSYVLNVELRRVVASLNIASARIDLELTPFMDAGRVFARPSTSPFSQLHYVGGLGLRGVARPYVVGYVDVGYGAEGASIFSGINYPF